MLLKTFTQHDCMASHFVINNKTRLTFFNVVHLDTIFACVLPNLHCYTILTKFERVVIYHHCMSGFYLEIFVGGGGGRRERVKHLGVDHIHFSLNHTHLISVIDWGIMTSEELQVIIS